MDSTTESKVISIREKLPSPLLIPVIFWVAGILSGKYLQAPMLGYLAGIFSLFLLAVVCKKTLRTILILLIIFGFGAIRFKSRQTQSSPLISILQSKGEIQQEMKFLVQSKLADGVYQIDLQQVAGIEVNQKVLMYYQKELDIGDSYSSLCKLETLNSDPVLDVYPQRFHALLRPVLPLHKLPVLASKSIINSTRMWIRERLDSRLGVYAPLAKAMLLSDTAFKQEHRPELSRAGITHLIVVSGLHVMLISFLLLMVLRLFLPMRVAEALFMLFLLLFAAINNWAPPISRAMLMIDLLIISRWLSRPLAVAQSLSVSLFIITLINPQELFQLGLQLSFLCVALIVFALPQSKPQATKSVIHKGIRKVADYALISLIVGLGIAPFTLYYFGTASLNGVLANLIGLPLMSILLFLSIIVLLFDWQPVILCFKAIADLWQYWLEFCAKLPLYIESNWISLHHAIALGLVILIGFLFLKARRKILLNYGIPIICIIAVLMFIPVKHKSEVYIFNAGVADCSLIFADDGSSLMIDAGGVPGFRAETDLAQESLSESWAQKKLLVWLARNRISTIDYLLITHLHTDHAGGLPSLLNHLKVKNLILSRTDLSSNTWLSIAPKLNLRNTRIMSISDTTSIQLGSHRIKILHPNNQFNNNDLNNNSIVLRYDSKSVRFLFTGDIEREAELWLTEHYPLELRADILKIPHHGSRSSSSEEFLYYIDPKESVITTSKRNVYGFPHAETIRRLDKMSTSLRYTYNGTIRYKTD